VGKENFLPLPLLLERVGVRLLKSFMRKSKKDFTHKGTKHTKLHKEILASASPSPFGEGRGEASFPWRK
jgi:hypothetical protein